MAKPIQIAVLALLLAAGSACGFDSTYSSMSVVGDWQNFNPAENNMYLVADHQWEAVFFISARGTNQFKFAANGGFSPDWGLITALPQTDPFSGTATQNPGFAQNIIHANIRDGFYRFRFNETNFFYSVELLAHHYTGPANDNLLRNGDFEQADLGNPERAYSWNYRPAMTYGDRYGNSGRTDWRFFSPTHEHYIGPPFGGVWQDVPAGRDFDYEASAWFWMDGNSNTNFGPWTAAVQRVKIEFYGPTRGAPLAEASTNIPFVPEVWNRVSFRAPAPPGAAWARFVIDVSGGGTKGSLQFDDVALRATPHPYQYFNSWDFTTTGTLARGGWVATNASMVTAADLAYAAPSLALHNGGHIRSPRVEQGIGRVAFRYRTSFIDPDEDPTDDLTVQVRTSPVGTGDTYATVATLNGIVQQSYTEFALNLDDPAQKYLELRVINGTNRFLVDNIEILPSEPDARFQDFARWTNSTLTNAGCHIVDNWQVCTGLVFNAGAFQAPSARLPGGTNGSNYIQTPLWTNGYGAVTFQLARGNNGAAPAELLVQESPDGTSWATVGSLSDIAGTGWTSHSLYFYQTQPRYIRILNTSTGTPSGGGSTLLISEGFAAAPAEPDGWFFNSISSYSSSGNFGLDSPSLRFDATGDYADTPELVSPTNLQFWIKGQSINAASRFEVLGYVTGSWVLVQAYTNISNSQVTNSLALSTNITRLRFLYQSKVAGNISFDDVVIRGVSLGGQPPQDILIDDILIGLPEEFRTQDFEAWPRKNFFNTGVHVFQGWRITNSIVNQENAFQGQSLRTSTDTGGFIQSPDFPDGIGLLAFDYARWPGTPTPTLAVQYSTNAGASWIAITNLSVANESPNYIRFERLLNIAVPASIRLIHTAGGRQVLIDNISVGFPQPPADVTLFGFHDPQTPFTNDTIRLNAVLSPIFGAQVTNVTAFYRFGTNGAFAPLLMVQTNFVFYQTTSLLGPHPTGTVIQYYFRAQFTGPGAAGTSPRFYPPGGSNAPAFYAIPRSKSGQVWINEVRYDALFDDAAFIELAGPALFNLSGWSIELLEVNPDGGLNTVFEKYVLPLGSALNTNASPFGFWVLGTQEIANRNMTSEDLFRSSFPPLPLGIRLLNEGGGVEHAISFGGMLANFYLVPASDNLDEFSSVGLAGAGTNYDEFVWSEFPGGQTPGTANAGQYFGDAPPPSGPPDAWISRLLWGTNITVTAVGNTNAWSVAPFFATSLTNNASWSPIAPYGASYTNGTNTVWFDRPVQDNWFLRLIFVAP
ncbi:MAG TPA: hypothetical protein PKE12_13855 [Kiritimatiellia bacterium]|nr:hypothetical protein [Kiritimatiellia bacterium]